MKWLLTAGPTREPMDPVRYLSNRSSGKMGYALARAAAKAGGEVTLVSGPVNLPVPEGVKEHVPVISSDEMADAVEARLEGVDIVLLVAAVCDFKPERVASSKLKKHDGIPQLVLVPTRDILATLGAMKGRRFFLGGFAAETDRLFEHAERKLREKRCDLIVGNDVSAPGIGFEVDENAATLFFRGEAPESFPRMSKEALAGEIVERIMRRVQNRVDSR